MSQTGGFTFPAVRFQPDGDSFRDVGNHFRRPLGWPSFANPSTLADGYVQVPGPWLTFVSLSDEAIVPDSDLSSGRPFLVTPFALQAFYSVPDQGSR